MLAYIIQMLLCAALLYGYYHLFLRNERFHQYNRYYLLSVMVLSLTLPLLNIPLYFTGKDTENILIQSLGAISVLKAEPVIVVSSKPSVPVITVDTILYIFYVAISLFLFIKIVMAIRKIYKLRAAHQTELIDDIEFIATNHPETPFSFFKWLFWNNNIPLNSDKGQQVFRHELYHIQKRHSWDLLFTELVLALCWFNPFYYFIRSEIKVIQEFLADKYATNEENTSVYAELLLMQAFGTYDQKLVNPFFHNQLKRRITMLTSSKKPAYQYLRKLMVLPVVAVAIMLFAFTYKKEIKGVKLAVENKIATLDKIIMPQQEPLKVYEKIKADIKDTVPGKKKIEPKKTIISPDEEVETNSLNEVVVVAFSDELVKDKSEPEVYTKVEISASYPGGNNSWREFLERNLRAEVPVINGAKPGRYHVFIQFIVNREGYVSNIKSLSKVGYGMEEEAMRVIQKSGKWMPAIFNGREVISYKKQPIVFQVLPKKITSGSLDESKKPDPEPEIFTKTEIEASYPGGAAEWKNFLEKNLKTEIPLEQKASVGNYTAIIQFVVNREGNVSDIRPITRHGYGMEEEAMRMIKISGKWKPAIQNGRAVKAYTKQQITFKITG